MRIVVAAGAAVALLAVHSPVSALPPGARVETYKGGLNFPIDMAWAKGSSRIFYTEKNSGKVRVMVKRKVLRRACVNLDVNNDNERGAMGIELSPNFSRNKHLFVFYTNRAPLENRVTRYTVKVNRCTNARHIVTGLPASSAQHHGGHLQIVGEKLFVSTGDQENPASSQSRASRVGKILRYNLDGSIPAGNPFRNAVWSTGQRNPWGLAHKPGTGRLYGSDNGPECDDEINRIARGRNYGWGPNYGCGTAGVGPDATPPIFRWSRPVAPTDAAWYRGRMASLSGSLLVTDFIYGRLHRFVLDQAGDRVVSHRVTYDSDGKLLDVFTGPGRWVYFVTPSAVYRIVPT